MATYNTSSDAANTMIRAFLTKVGESYLEHSFNTGSGKGKEIWTKIKRETFENKCAFCGESSENLTIEHLVMFNREQCGLHHPGNIVPCCKPCNKRQRHQDTKQYYDWMEHMLGMFKIYFCIMFWIFRLINSSVNSRFQYSSV